jgi:oligoendopeptidase F
MFAEFEMQVHAAVEKGEVMTPDRLCEIYGGLNKKYFGPDVVYDDEIAMEWARIPHFYNAFYVYKYATGYSAAVALSRKIIEEGKPARDAYLEFLAAGDSDYPIELLKRAGVDMSKPDVIESAMSTFESLIDELEELINE